MPNVTLFVLYRFFRRSNWFGAICTTEREPQEQTKRQIASQWNSTFSNTTGDEASWRGDKKIPSPQVTEMERGDGSF
jgi:hypothetical protein